MKPLLLTLIALSLCTAARAERSNAGIVGSFELKMGNPDNSLSIQLECDSASSCTFTRVSQWKGNPPDQHKQVLRNVHPVNDLTYATNALKYAIGQQAMTIKNAEYSESMKRLAPVLAAAPAVDTCWDLSYPEPGYMLACTLTDAPPENPPLYLFTTLLASCGEAFCRYVINPMQRIK